MMEGGINLEYGINDFYLNDVTNTKFFHNLKKNETRLKRSRLSQFLYFEWTYQAAIFYRMSLHGY